MKTTIKVFAITGIILGACAILNCVNEATWEGLFYAFVGGAIFLSWGICDLVLLKSLEK